ncbi:MAG: serine hydrolase [Tannerella sp.]|jgi:beta-glucosidase-like glycosyl hydrolase/CubicO group peptidase (beta-lactamase class C family)|nr:serine hydrolase [Tannerella sp.]
MMKKILYPAFLFYVCCFRMSAQTEPTLHAAVSQAEMNHWVDSVFDTMSEDERIGQLFMVIAYPKSDAKHLQMLEGYIRRAKIGGVLFQKGDPLTQADVTNRLQKAARIPLFVALDGEWGLSMRLSETTRFPKNMMLGAIEDLRLIEEYAGEVGRQCNEMGIHINFAPVLDVNSNVNNPVIGLRSFGEKTEDVAARGLAYARGLESAGVLSVAKHFPGHGDTSEDSHHTLPSVLRPAEALDSIELLPFRRYIEAGFAGIMTSHLYVPALDSTENLATSMSGRVVTDLLQQKMGFRGLCITDAMEMKGAVTGRAESRPVQALLAGNDIVLAPGVPEKELEAVGKAIQDRILTRETIHAKCRKILQYKYIAGLNRYRPVELKGLYGRLNTSRATWLAARLNAEAITVLKNDGGLLPLKQLDKRKMAVLSVGNAPGDVFPEMLNAYAPLPFYRITKETKEAEIRKIAGELEAYDALVCGIYPGRGMPQAIRQLAEKKQTVYVFFTLPYVCAEYRALLNKAGGVVMAYENTRDAQNYAAQAVFGGIPARGKLAVTVPGLFSAGDGIATPKTRLGYHRPEEVGLDAARLDSIDLTVGEGLAERAYPGCQVLVARNGMIVYHKSFGYFDYEQTQQVTPASVYDLASVSKATGTLLAVMQLYDRKLCTLDAPVSLYLPALQNSDKSDLRVEELLYHQSGLPSIIGFYMNAIDGNSFTGKLFSRTKTPVYPVRYESQTYARTDFKFLPDVVSESRKEGFSTEVAADFFLTDSFPVMIMNDIRDAKLKPRGQYAYSCVNFILLKMMVERQARQPMDRFLDMHFFRRLGAATATYNPLKKMDISQIVPTEDDRFLRHQLLRGYVHDEAAAFQGGVSGNAGLFSSANDLAKILQLYLNAGTYGGERYLSEATCRLFTEIKSPTSRRGLGFDKPEADTLKVSPCSRLAPLSAYGHNGFTGTCFWVDPDSHLIYIFLSNRIYPSRVNGKLSSLKIRERIQDILYRAIIDIKL